MNSPRHFILPRVFDRFKMAPLLLRTHKLDFSPCSATSTSVKGRRQIPSLDYINEDRRNKQLVLTQANLDPLSRFDSTAGTDYWCRLGVQSAVRQRWHRIFTSSDLKKKKKNVFE